MRKSVGIRVMGGFLLGTVLAGLAPSAAHGQEKAAESLKLKVGDPAPEFTMRYFNGSDLKEVHLSDYRGRKNVVLAFYIFAFTGG